LEKKRLIIGEIPYANLFPIFYMLRKENDISEYEFTEGVPSDLNKKIRNGLIDVSPSSSIEYLRHPEKYELIENHSISSKGPVGSILLFSKKSIEKLDGHTILTSSQSETSAALIRIVLKIFYRLDCSFVSSDRPVEDAFDSGTPYLLIGDEALTEELNRSDFNVYDIGQEWYKHTGLPFTFALWIARRDCCGDKKDLYLRFVHDLDRAKISALNNFKLIAASCPLKDRLSEEGLVAYWQKISYDLDMEHRKGLELFRRYAEELCLL
jgi:chorismate dehydratase